MLFIAVGLFPITARAAGHGYRPGGNNHGTGNTSVNHIDIGVDLTASIFIDGIEKQAEFTINTSDSQYVTITAVPSNTNFSLSGDVSTSTDNQGKKQIRIEGDFPVGTESEPISYTVTLSKTITTNDGHNVPVTLSATMHYWDGGNVCPGYQQRPGNQSGIDLVLSNGTGSSVTKGNIQIQKTIEGVELLEDKTFYFRLLDAVGNVYRDNVAVKVPAGHKMASIILTNVDLGTYTVEEISPIEEISGCALKSIEYTNNGSTTISTSDNSSIVNVTSTYQAIQLTQYTISFTDHDGRVINQTVYDEGSEILIPVNPTRPADKKYNYKFKGWNKDVASIAKENATYEAVYDAEYINYQIQFVNWDGSELLSSTYHYEDNITLPAEPIKPADEKFTYAFRGYVPAVETVTDNQVYTAVYDAVPIVSEYTIIFEDYDGTEISKSVYPEGSQITVPEAPERDSDEPKKYTWIFAGWDKEVAEIATENVIYTAQYRQQQTNYTVSFVDWNEDVLRINTYHYGEMPVAPANPTRPADSEYTYTFIGWDKEVVSVTGNVLYEAIYEAVSLPKKYTVTFEDFDGSVLDETVYAEGDQIIIPKSPERGSDEPKVYTWEFTGWNKKIADFATQDVIYTAQYEKRYVNYTVSFINWNEKLLKSDIYHYGDMPVAPKDPIRPADSENTYTFVSWNKEIIVVTGDVVYQAVYEATPIIKEYTVTFNDWNGRLISETVYKEGSKITVPEIPSRISDKPEEYSWQFVGWDKEVSPTVVEDISYIAQYEKKYIDYTVIFIDWNKDLIKSSLYHYGDIPLVPEVPSRPADSNYIYTFKGWDQDIMPVSEDVVYQAIYETITASKEDTGNTSVSKPVEDHNQGTMPEISIEKEDGYDNVPKTGDAFYILLLFLFTACGNISLLLFLKRT